MVGFDPSHFQMVSNPVWCYRGNGACPSWKDVDPGQSYRAVPINNFNITLIFPLENFEEFCHVSADLSQIPLIPETNDSGFTFYRVQFDIILLFGLTEIQAQMGWYENVSLPTLVRALVFD